MPPEVYFGVKSYTKEADIWMAGLLLASYLYNTPYYNNSRDQYEYLDFLKRHFDPLEVS